MTIEVRLAQPNDKGSIAELMHSSGVDLYRFLYGERALDYLRYEFASGNGFAGYNNVTVAVDEAGNVVGTGCFYGAENYANLAKGSVANMQAFFGEEDVVPVLARARHTGSVMKPPRGGEVYLSNFGVSPALRGQGIGTQIVSFALDRARRESYSIFGLDVSVANPRGQALYARLGLEVVEEKEFSADDAGVPPSRKMEMVLQAKVQK